MIEWKYNFLKELKENIDKVDDINKSIDTCLTTAVNLQNFEAVKLLLDKGADINKSTGFYFNNRPPILEAALGDNVEIARLLLDRGADVNHVDDEGKTPLYMLAYYGGSVEVAKLLIDRGANVNHVYNDFASVLLVAIERGLNEIVKLLLANGADIEQARKFSMNNRSLLQIAINLDNAEMFKLLLGKESDITLKKALFKTIEQSRYKMVEILINKGVNINDYDDDGLKPLYYAVKFNDLKIAQLLIDNGSEISNIREGIETRRQSLLVVAIKYNNLDFAKLSLENGADLNEGEYFGETALHTSIISNSLNISKLLIAKGADINKPDFNYQTPLFVASRYKRNDILRMLIDKGADVNIADKDGCTALHAAVFNQNIESIILLISKGLDVYHKNNDRKTPLFYANEQVIKSINYLLKNNTKASKYKTKIRQLIKYCKNSLKSCIIVKN